MSKATDSIKILSKTFPMSEAIGIVIAEQLERIADALEQQSAGSDFGSILLEIDRSKNQFGEPVVAFRSSPL